MKTVYKIDPATGAYLGEVNCQVSPLDPEDYLVPANTTQVAPPVAGDNEVAVLSEQGWTLQPDHRGNWYDDINLEHNITEIGQLPMEGWTREPKPADTSIPGQIAARLKAINLDCEITIAQISAGYPTSEVLSWPKQETEARAWLANNSAATPLVDALAAARGVAKADLVDRIIEKADLFAQVSGQLIGQRQLLEDQLDALLSRHEDPQNTVPVTPEEIEVIVWPA